MTKPKIENTHRNVLTVRFDGVEAGWEQWFLLSADRHHDNRLTDWVLEKKHLTKAADRDAYILDCGDFFCAMQGKWDTRSDQTQMRPEHREANNYLDLLVSTAVEFYKPWADRFMMIGKGNHESNVEKRHGVNLITNFVDKLNSDKIGGNCAYGYYGGWIRFMFTANKTKRMSRNLYYHHGAGGGGPVTRGTIQSNRQAATIKDADYVINGHTHDAWHLPIARACLSNKGKPYQGLQHHVRTPGYKRDYNDGAEGFHVERWAPPKPVGCVWMRLYFEAEKIHTEFIIDAE